MTQVNRLTQKDINTIYWMVEAQKMTHNDVAKKFDIKDVSVISLIVKIQASLRRSPMLK